MCMFFALRGHILGYLESTVIIKISMETMTFHSHSVKLEEIITVCVFFHGFLAFLCPVHPLLIVITIIENVLKMIFLSLEASFPLCIDLMHQTLFPISKRCYRMSGKAVFCSFPQV